MAVCACCGSSVPVGREMRVEDKVWNRDHFRCSLCNLSLSNPYYRDDVWEWRVCNTHRRLIVCDVCARPFPGHYNDPATLDLCDICQPDAVTDDQEAANRYRDAVAWIRAEGLTGDGATRLPLRVVDARWFHDRFGHPESGLVFGVARHRTPDFGQGRSGAFHHDIAILRGLPDPMFQAVAVHELGHAWLTINGVDGLSDIAEEGFCQVLMYRFLIQASHRAAPGYAAKITRSDDPVYGPGFRMVDAIVSRLGFDAVVASLLAERQLPVR
jgi:hypothetical protein